MQKKKKETEVAIELYLCRHGETDFNAMGLFQGQGVNASLNPTGETQARQLGNIFEHQLPKIDFGFVSPLLRAKETAELVQNTLSKDRQFPLVENILILEGSFGDAEGEFKEDFKRKNPEVYKQWRTHDNPEAKLTGGETQEEIWTRGLKFLDNVVHFVNTSEADILKNRTEKNKPSSPVRIAVFSHAAFTRCLLYRFGVKIDKIPNAQPLKFTYTPKEGWQFNGFLVSKQQEHVSEQEHTRNR